MYLLSLHLTQNILLILISIFALRVSKEESVTYMLVSSQLVARASGVPITSVEIGFVDSASFRISCNDSSDKEHVDSMLLVLFLFISVEINDNVCS
jgi:hypothetical protein